jgi:purine-cytosine permease-like protein
MEQRPRTLQQQARLFPPPTPGQKVAIDVMAGLSVGFFVWMLLGAPGISGPDQD